MSIFLFLLFLTVQCKSQITKNTLCEGNKILLDTGINVYIKDKKDQQVIEKTFFQTPFQLEVSDDSAQIISYYVSWHNTMTGISYMWSNKGNIVDPNPDSKDVEYRTAASLKRLNSGTKLALEMMLIKKDGNCYIIPPLIVTVN
jgi:hypothetical protein